MTKYVITTAQVIKRVYVIEASSESEALGKLGTANETLHLGEQTFGVETINEYEYNRTWKPKPDYSEGHDWQPQRHSSEWIHSPHDGRRETLKKDHEGYQYDAFKDQDLFRDD